MSESTDVNFYTAGKIALQTFQPWLDCSHEKIVKHLRWWPVISVLIFPIILLFFTPQFLFYTFFAHLKNFLLFLRLQKLPGQLPQTLKHFQFQYDAGPLIKRKCSFLKWKKRRKFLFSVNTSRPTNINYTSVTPMRTFLMMVGEMLICANNVYGSYS